MRDRLPTFEDVLEAQKRIQGVTVQTPLIHSDVLSERLQRPVFLKCENLQKTGSFKLRGAYNRLSALLDEERKAGVVAFSSGNHAQGVARAAKLLDMPAVIVMPHDTPEVKINGVKSDGAEIVRYDRASESRETIAARLCEERGAVLVPSYDDQYIIAGQGTCGLEIAAQLPDELSLGTLVCCVGGGGLIAGISLAVRQSWPGVEIIGAEPHEYDDYARSLEAGERQSLTAYPPTICDALQTPMPGALTFAINKDHLSGIARITDDGAFQAMKWCASEHKLVLEPGGAAALAAVLTGKAAPSGEGALVIVLTGGNVDPAILTRALNA